MHCLRLAPLPLSLQEETLLFTVDNWGVMNNCSEYERALCTTSRDGKKRRDWGRATGWCLMFNRHESLSVRGILVFPLCSPLSLSLSPVTPEIKCWRSQIATEEWLESAVVPLSSLYPLLQASHTEEGRSSPALCSGVGFVSKPLWPCKLCCSWGLLIKNAACLT